MWSSIETLKQNLNKIALDVHDGDDNDEEFTIYGSSNDNGSSVSRRRNSHSFAHSKSVSQSPIANGLDSPHNSEVCFFLFKLLIFLFLFLFLSIRLI